MLAKPILTVAACVLALGCAGAPKSTAKRNALKSDAHETIATMTADDPSLRPLLDRSAGYVVFPEVKQGGFVVGGASSRGVLFERGKAIGFTELSQASVGAQIGGQKFSEIVVLEDQNALDRVKTNQLAVGAQASAVAIRAGAASSTRFESGVAVFVKPIGGAMLNVSLTGQQIRFKG